MPTTLRSIWAAPTIVSPRGDRFAPVRVSKDVLRRVNVSLGYPVTSAEELAKREAAAAKLVTLRACRVLRRMA